MRLSDLAVLEAEAAARGWFVAFETYDSGLGEWIPDELTADDGLGFASMEEAQGWANRLARFVRSGRMRFVRVIGPYGVDGVGAVMVDPPEPASESEVAAPNVELPMVPPPATQAVTGGPFTLLVQANGRAIVGDGMGRVTLLGQEALEQLAAQAPLARPRRTVFPVVMIGDRELEFARVGEGAGLGAWVAFAAAEGGNGGTWFVRQE